MSPLALNRLSSLHVDKARAPLSTATTGRCQSQPATCHGSRDRRHHRQLRSSNVNASSSTLTTASLLNPHSSHSSSASPLSSFSSSAPYHVLPRFVLFCLLPSLLPLCSAAAKGSHPYWQWIKGTATFYGGSDGSGTMGGACGYGNLYRTGYGLANAAASMYLFGDGEICGSCLQVKCNPSLTSWCLPGSPSVVVTITNLCPANYALPNNAGGWCNPPRKHLDMSMPAWLQIGKYKAGIIPINMRRVPCIKNGGVQFTLSGNPWFLSVMVSNVAGSGDVNSMWVQLNDGGWHPMKRNWGQIWSMGSSTRLTGKAMGFRLMTKWSKERLICPNAVPSNWGFGGSYQSKNNYWVSPDAAAREA
eukprot:TRINITY_DN802_c0_g1_i1.p1 TRINITY_DN802_c0_g1~~TRINITY_DN802_c0_g1_i1.p1  ORF type:complete len:361 (-),score=28.03 TRINITY_DN802_c0_g1_i1:421-1503(-)